MQHWGKLAVAFLDASVILCRWWIDRHTGLEMGILQANIPGKYHVNARCIGCTICSEIAPHNFRSDHEQGYDYVYKQPDNEIEESLCAEAMDICPVNAIGHSGTGHQFGPA
jgi:ferredoxin